MSLEICELRGYTTDVSGGLQGVHPLRLAGIPQSDAVFAAEGTDTMRNAARTLYTLFEHNVRSSISAVV